MGYELYREVKMHAPQTLTHREKLTAMVLADDANDDTRTTWNSAFTAETLAHCMVKNERDMRKILARLQDEKVIEHIGGGHNGRVAKFRFLALGPATVAGPERTAYEEPEVEAPVLKEPPTEGVGGSFRHRRRSKKNLPTPSSPQNLSSPPAPTAPEPQQAPTACNDERETPAAPKNHNVAPQSDKQPHNDQADTVVAAYLTAAGRPVSSTTRSKLHAQAAQLLTDGFPATWLADRARELAARGWTDLAQHCDRSTVPTHAKPTATKADWCGQCDDPNYRQIRDPKRDNELTDCPACNPAALARARRATEGAAA